jgi:hypothetical protein
VQPNWAHLRAALNQRGPREEQEQAIDSRWLVDTLKEKIATIDWTAAAADVERSLGPAERESLKLWSTRFFSTKAAQLGSS